MNETSGKPASARSARFPRRFYKEASVGTHEAGFAILLDGRVAKTPAGNPLAVGSQRVAEALAAEWAAQGERLDPAAMPLTRIVNAAIDRVAGETDAVRAEIVKYAGTDLICYRAEGPASLVAAQAAAWGPLIAWAQEALGVRLTLAEGIVHVAQDESALVAIDAALQPLDALSLAALSTITALTGSAVIALAVLKGRLTIDEAWAAAHIDEDWQMSHWGTDEGALVRRAARRREMDAAGVVLGCSTDRPAAGPQAGRA
jgi:chaperone required for assembly of F1-ATPase